MEQLSLTPNTPEWLEARKQYRTASEAPIVLGVSPFTTPEQFKLIKAGLKKTYYSKAMQLGHELEAQIRDHANQLFGKTFKEEIWVNGEFLASLDGIDGDTLVEIKTSDYTYRELVEGDVPKHYYAQIQQQLYCSPAEKAYLVAYSPKAKEYAISEEITLDPLFMRTISEAWDAFDAMPIPEVPMDFSGDGEIRELFDEYETLKGVADATKAKMDEIKALLIEKANDKGLVCDDYKLTAKAGAVSYDYRGACKDAKLDMESYKKQGKPTYSVTLPKSPFEAEHE